MTTSLATQPSPVCAVVTVLRVGEGVGVGEWLGPGEFVAEAWAKAPTPDGATVGVTGVLAWGTVAVFGWPTSAAELVALLPPTTPFTAHARSPIIAMPSASAISRRRQKMSGWGARCWSPGAFGPIPR